MNRFYSIAAAVLAVLLVFGPIKDLLIQSALVSAIRSNTGVDAKIGYLSTNIFNQSLTVRNMKLLNPPGLAAGEVMADIPLAEFKVDVPALFSNTLHVPYMRLVVREARVIRGRDKQYNVNMTKLVPAAAAGAGAQPRQEHPAVTSGGKAWQIRFDLVSLNIGKVTMEDYSSGRDKPRTMVVELHQKDMEIRDVTSFSQFGSAFLVQTVAPAGIEGILGSLLRKRAR